MNQLDLEDRLFELAYKINGTKVSSASEAIARISQYIDESRVSSTKSSK